MFAQDDSESRNVSTSVGAPTPELSVVIPAHDEGDNVLPLLAEVRAALDGRVDYEVVFVDDGSDDDTAARLREAARDFPRLRTVRHRFPCGQSAATATGVRFARAPWIATLDGDGQNDPSDIPRLLAVRDAHPSGRLLVNGHRVTRRDTWLKRLSSKIANGVRGRVLGDQTPDTGCGLKLFPRELFLALPHFDHMHRFVPALVRRGGGDVLSVPVGHRERLRGRSHYGLGNRLWTGIVDLIGVLWLQRRSKLPVVVEPGGAPRPTGEE